MSCTIEIDTIEEQRIALQAELDSKKTQAERNFLGQFATPTALALDILKYSSTIIDEGIPIRFLDPAIGTGAFYSALQKVFTKEQVIEALGFEIDPHYEEPASQLWANHALAIKRADFTEVEPSPRFNLVICNPPYVRHHHIKNGVKAKLQLLTFRASGMKISGLAGLYCHFLCLTHSWMVDEGIAGWLIPSEFMNVNYGQAIKKYLLEKVTLLHIHRFDPKDSQFADALVSSAVVWFKKSPPPKEHAIKFTYGGTLLKPGICKFYSSRDLSCLPKWTVLPNATAHSSNSSKAVLSEFFKIKRGLATGDNEYFILDSKEISERNLPTQIFRPILPSPRYLIDNIVSCDSRGYPVLANQLFLLDTRLSEEEIKNNYPSLFAYLREGKCRGIHERYLCQHRSPWYSQEDRPPAPIVCTYLGRSDTKNGRPFRFILNKSIATVANVYLAMYPTTVLSNAMAHDSTMISRVWEILNKITPEQLLNEGRVYGGGLHKLEPKELANVDATEIAEMLPNYNSILKVKQRSLLESEEILLPVS